MSATPSSGTVKLNPPAFYCAAAVILLFSLVVIGSPEQAGAWLLQAQTWAANTVGWYYLLAMSLYLVFVVVTALSGYGKIKLGADQTNPSSAICLGPACCSPRASASPCSSFAYPNP